MKKSILFSLAFILFSSVIVFGQEIKTPPFYFCNPAGEAVYIADLEKCSLLSASDPKLKVESFALSYVIDGKVLESRITGNKVDAETIAKLKKEQKKLANNQIRLDKIKTKVEGKDVFERQSIIIKIKD